MKAEQKLINDANYGITMALWLSQDSYDHEQGAGLDGPVVSATSLLKPTRMIILSSRAKTTQTVSSDVAMSSLGAARIGQAVHGDVEAAFTAPGRTEKLVAAGFGAKMAERIRVNPSDADLANDDTIIPVYLEMRAYKKVLLSSGTSLYVSGKFDQVVGGKVEDNKSTKAYSYIKMDQTEKSGYAKQQSIYRWLNPDKIKSDIGQINFIFTDWKKSDVSTIKGYPPRQVMEMPLQLASVEDTERFVISKLDEIERCSLLDEKDLPECPEEELWKNPDKHKYYSKVETLKAGGRSTKNFDTLQEAIQHKRAKGKGVIQTVPGLVRRCGYCDGAPLCTQRLKYL